MIKRTSGGMRQEASARAVKSEPRRQKGGFVKASFANMGKQLTPAASINDSSATNASRPTNATRSSANATAVKPASPFLLNLNLPRRKNFADPNLVGYRDALLTLKTYFPVFDVADGNQVENGVIDYPGIQNDASNSALQKTVQFFSDHPEYENRLTKGHKAAINRRLINSELTRAEEAMTYGDINIGSVADNQLLPDLERAYRDALWSLKYNFDTYQTAEDNLFPDSQISDNDFDAVGKLSGHASERLMSPAYFFNDHPEYLKRLKNNLGSVTLQNIDSELRDIQDRQAAAAAGLAPNPG